MIRAHAVAMTLSHAQFRRDLLEHNLGPECRADEVVIRRGERFDVIATADDVIRACLDVLWEIDVDRRTNVPPATVHH